jgi:hypothetical protein
MALVRLSHTAGYCMLADVKNALRHQTVREDFVTLGPIESLRTAQLTRLHENNSCAAAQHAMHIVQVTVTILDAAALHDSCRPS